MCDWLAGRPVWLAVTGRPGVRVAIVVWGGCCHWQQMEEKKRREKEEKEKEAREEELLMKRIEEENERIKKQEDEEKRQKREKEAEVRTCWIVSPLYSSFYVTNATLIIVYLMQGIMLMSTVLPTCTCLGRKLANRSHVAVSAINTNTLCCWCCKSSSHCSIFFDPVDLLYTLFYHYKLHPALQRLAN